MKKGAKYMMANITHEQQASMQLDWTWEAGKIIIYKEPVLLNKHHYYSIERDAPASMYEIPNKSSSIVRNETIWIYDEYVVPACIWQ